MDGVENCAIFPFKLAQLVKFFFGKITPFQKKKIDEIILSSCRLALQKLVIISKFNNIIIAQEV